MAMIRCPDCGERYSDTYRDCPFCEEEEALRDGEEIRRSPRRGKRAARHSRQYSLVTPTLIILIILMAGLLIYLLYGDRIVKDKSQQQNVTEESVTSEQENAGVMPEDQTQTEETGEPSGETETTQPEDPVSDYDAAMALPDGLSLSTTDFTLRTAGETAVIRASGGSNSYTWISQDPGIASVDETGKVTAVSKGTINVVATDGSKKAVCIVRVTASGSSAATTTTPTTSTTSGLKAGAGRVVNAGNGVRVRSGPGTSYEILATIANGGDVNIVESAADGWYKVTFSDVSGKTTTGYIKGDYLANK